MATCSVTTASGHRGFIASRFDSAWPRCASDRARASPRGCGVSAGVRPARRVARMPGGNDHHVLPCSRYRLARRKGHRNARTTILDASLGQRAPRQGYDGGPHASMWPFRAVIRAAGKLAARASVCASDTAPSHFARQSHSPCSAVSPQKRPAVTPPSSYSITHQSAPFQRVRP